MNICEEHSLYCSVIEFRTAYFYEVYEQSVHTLTTVELARANIMVSFVYIEDVDCFEIESTALKIYEKHSLADQ